MASSGEAMSEAMSEARLAEIRRWQVGYHDRFRTGWDGPAIDAVGELLAEVERLRARERPLLVLLRAVAAGEPLHENFMWQARGWLEAERSADDGG